MDLVVTPDGIADWRGRSMRCALGRSGIVAAGDKREGDGATPAGRWAFRRVLFRDDRIAAPGSVLPTRAIAPTDGWCDDPGHPDYNRPVTLPFAAGHEKMWRDDALYDLVVVLGHNDGPPEPGMGSAIFLHVAAAGHAPTEGCVALDLEDLLGIVEQCGLDSGVDIRR